MQETLLPSTTKAQNPEGYAMIILEQTTNISKELDQPSSSSKDFNDVALWGKARKVRKYTSLCKSC